MEKSNPDFLTPVVSSEYEMCRSDMNSPDDVRLSTKSVHQLNLVHLKFDALLITNAACQNTKLVSLEKLMKCLHGSRNLLLLLLIVLLFL